jgi:hypothetical protein
MLWVRVLLLSNGYRTERPDTPMLYAEQLSALVARACGNRGIVAVLGPSS